MTSGTGKRSYRACLRCRQRKTRCDLDKVGEPKKAPCVSCHDSGSECILVKSRRGGNFRLHRAGSSLSTATRTSRRDALGLLMGRTSDYASNTMRGSADGSDSVEEEEEAATGAVLSMQLRNPSDALHILALSGEVQSSNQPRDGNLPVAGPGDGRNAAPRDVGAVASNETRAHRPWKPASTELDGYELVQRGLLSPSVVYELQHRYARYYHPYCPIVPAYLLLPSNIERIQRSDYFLLTAILTIASRDDPRHSLTHRYCWDHAQRLLIDVLLALPWTQTPSTVEGLLLLAEWPPHIQIQETTAEAPKTLLGEDRTAWSLVGLAVRQGYLQRLDQGAFRNLHSSQSKERTELNRLVWACIWVADRQISVRLGQSFWSRGPSSGAKFTAQDFPSLQPHPDNGNEDYASVLQATMGLIQILHNAHAILYASKERTLAMVYEGNYSRYLDDFRTAARTWHSMWRHLAVSSKIKSTLLIMYEYICLYTNAFSFQAVLTRASDPRMSSKIEQQNKRPFAELLSTGIMASPDGQFIFDAINAARNLLSLMNDLDPRQVLCYLPSRYYLYGVYAAVFLHKADCTGAFQSGNQRQEITSLARDFISVLEKAPSTELHICHSYSRMLKQLWNRRERRHSRHARGLNETTASTPQPQQQLPLSPQTDGQQPPSPAGNSNSNSNSNSESFSMPQLFDPLAVESEMAAFASIEGYFQGSFMPGVADFSSPTLFDGASGQQYPLPGGFQDWGLGQPDFNPPGSLQGLASI
ncbi:C6 transcription factor [Aspergillus varians]